VKTLFTAVRALIVSASFVWLWGWVALWVRVYDDRFGLHLPAWTITLGLPVMAVGAALALACIGTFVLIGRGTPAPFDAPRQFVSVGPYRYVRNPMYISGLLVLIGFGLLQSSGAILVFCMGWLLLAHVFVITYEEPRLRRHFGASYQHYFRTVSRWLPGRPAADRNAHRMAVGR
jgi:protein-S-isoprenylcysteine O-methyltransferase Ste14